MSKKKNAVKKEDVIDVNFEEVEKTEEEVCEGKDSKKTKKPGRIKEILSTAGKVGIGMLAGATGLAVMSILKGGNDKCTCDCETDSEDEDNDEEEYPGD